MKPKLLIVELWGLGDLVIATPFLRAVAERFEVTLLAKPFALELRPRLWPGVRVEAFIAPWTAFQRKYRFWRWPWLELYNLKRRLSAEFFDFGLSARWDPRDHLLLKIMNAKNRLGFPRLQSQVFLTLPLERPDPVSHRYESWRAIARAMNVPLPPREEIQPPAVPGGNAVLIHTGAGQPVRVWPLDRYQQLAARLRHEGIPVQIACDPDQRAWWLSAGETRVATPSTVTGLIALIDQAGAFIGNDSGPGHLAAFCGVPTFTLFGPQLPEWFAPLHPAAEWMEGKVCPYMPCSDYCRFPKPHCLWSIEEKDVWSRVENFIGKHLSASVH
ncbi:MAG TPA: glycosyltransferase family 9 protein [Candidatus Acidoferrum sp.]|nr:glycosyltransferase family 9 protein [Candidatus Acidoferrum sp.]